MLIFFSLKIPLLYHAMQPQGHMVKERDFEAEKKIKINNFFFLMAIIGLFQFDSWCLSVQNWLQVANNDISIQKFPKFMPHYTPHYIVPCWISTRAQLGFGYCQFCTNKWHKGAFKNYVYKRRGVGGRKIDFLSTFIQQKMSTEGDKKPKSCQLSP